jgi:hypothetical protein
VPTRKGVAFSGGGGVGWRRKQQDQRRLQAAAARPQAAVTCLLPFYQHCPCLGCLFHHNPSPHLSSLPPEATFRMTPPSLTKAISRVFLPDANLASDIDGYLKVGLGGRRPG